jgi:hypothetical protein
VFQKRQIVWFLTAGLVSALVLYFMHKTKDDEKQASIPAVETVLEPASAAIPKPAPKPTRKSASKSASNNADTNISKTNLQPAASQETQTAADKGEPECSRDEDCRGPRHADCIKTSCSQGKCYYDRSACECQKSDDCDDGDPCTRNHCFVPTMSCIYIPKDDCK